MFKRKSKVERIKDMIRNIISIDRGLANDALNKANKFIEDPRIHAMYMDDYRYFRDDMLSYMHILDLIDEEFR